jgi:UDP-3-O-[3-hydroxymyristoyl] glucosamine N-acyltransferase
MTAAYTTGSVAKLLEADLAGPADLPITHLDAIDHAGDGALTFIRSERYASAWAGSRASAALVTRGVEVPGHDPSRRALLIVANADDALTHALNLFASEHEPPESGVDPTAKVDPTASISDSASIGPHCTIGPRAVVGDRTTLGPGVVLGADARVGQDCSVAASVAILERCVVGDRCIIQAGAVIGAEGFGYAPTPDGPKRIPHVGNVVIHDDVDIGANTCIDRAKLGSTTVGQGTKIDNLVQIAHNCRIGRACIICGRVGISGSVTLGDGVVLGGGVGIADNLSLGDGAQVGAAGGVMNNIPAGETWIGYPAGLAREQAGNYAALRKLAPMLRQIKKRLAELEHADADAAP